MPAVVLSADLAPWRAEAPSGGYGGVEQGLFRQSSAARTTVSSTARSGAVLEDIQSLYRADKKDRHLGGRLVGRDFAAVAGAFDCTGERGFQASEVNPIGLGDLRVPQRKLDNRVGDAPASFPVAVDHRFDQIREVILNAGQPQGFEFNRSMAWCDTTRM